MLKARGIQKILATSLLPLPEQINLTRVSLVRAKTLEAAKSLGEIISRGSPPPVPLLISSRRKKFDFCCYRIWASILVDNEREKMTKA